MTKCYYNFFTNYGFSIFCKYLKCSHFRDIYWLQLYLDYILHFYDGL